MCLHQFKSGSIHLRIKRFKTNFLTPLVILGAIWVGLSQPPFGLEIANVLSNSFMRAFKCISTPIIFLSMIVALTKHLEEKKGVDQVVDRLWGRTLFYTLLTTLLAALISMGLYLLIEPAVLDTTHALRNEFREFKEATYSDHILSIIPDNLLKPFIEHQVISILLLSILMGLSIRKLPEQSRGVLVNFISGLHGIFLNVTHWIIQIIPLGLFGFIVTMVSDFKTKNYIVGLGEYLLVIVFANLLQGFIVLPLLLYKNKINAFQTFRKVLPALSLAFFSKSSVGTLPMTMEMVEKELKIPSKISRFVLPLCTTINMNGCAAFIWVTVTYVLQSNGHPLSLLEMFVWVLIATIAAVGNAGVPMGCFFLSISLLSSMNQSIYLLGLILPFYAILDMIETALNVWSDICVTRLVEKNER